MLQFHPDKNPQCKKEIHIKCSLINQANDYLKEI